MIRLSPINRRRLRNFSANRRAFWSLWIFLALFIVSLTGLLQFRFNTCRKTAKRMEHYAGMYIIAFDLTLAIEIVRAFGIQL